MHAMKNKEMSKTILFGLIIIGFLILATRSTKASDPEQVIVGYTLESGSIWVDVYHQTEDPDSHYISKIEAKLNGLEVIEEIYTAQPTNNLFGIIESGFILEDGDVIEALVFCITGGELHDSITVGEQSSLASPLWIAIVALTTAALLIPIMRRK